jgi:hypothetical protein
MLFVQQSIPHNPMRAQPAGDDTPTANNPGRKRDTPSVKGQVEADRTNLIIGPPEIHSALDKFTKGPMPQVQDAHPTSIFQHLDLNLIGNWEDLQCGKLIALPFDNEVRSSSAHKDIKGRIMATVAEITKSQGVGVATPHASEEAAKAKWSPIAFLVYNLTTDQANILLEHRTWSSPSMTF